MLKLDAPMSESSESRGDLGSPVIPTPPTMAVGRCACESASCGSGRPQVAPTQPTSSRPVGFFGRLKKLKNKEIYIAAAVVLVMIFIYASNFLGGGSAPSVPSGSHIAPPHGFARDMEMRLVRTLSNVAGAGTVDAMVTIVSTPSREIAFIVNEQTVTQAGPNGTTNTTTTVTKTPVLVGGQPFIVYERKPQITGVLIVASGAYNIQVRFNLLRAVQSLVPDNSTQIEILH